MIDQVFVPAVVAATTAAAWWFASRKLGWTRRAVIPAGGKVLECVGAAVVFALMNAAIGAALILGTRAFSGRFVSLYLGADHTLLALSALQALAFQWWRESSRRQ
jgi:hypothetical protein